MELISRAFGKHQDISRNDLLSAIGVLKESYTCDFKDESDATGITKLENVREKLVLRPLISFLNDSGSGLLLLGGSDRLKTASREAKGTLRRVDGVTPAFVKNSEQLRAIILDGIVSTPMRPDCITVEIIDVPISDSHVVYLIEVRSNSASLSFYSSYSNLSYLRRGDSTDPLTPNEFTEMVSRKSAPRLEVNLEDAGKSFGKRKLRFMITNVGEVPAKYALVLFDIPLVTGQEVSLGGEYTQVLQNELGLFRGQIITAYPPQSVFVYPGLSASIGTLTWSSPSDEMFIKISCFEDKGRTKQEIRVRVEGDKVLFKEELNEFTSYLK